MPFARNYINGSAKFQPDAYLSLAQTSTTSCTDGRPAHKAEESTLTSTKHMLQTHFTQYLPNTDTPLSTRLLALPNIHTLEQGAHQWSITYACRQTARKESKHADFYIALLTNWCHLRKSTNSWITSPSSLCVISRWDMTESEKTCLDKDKYVTALNCFTHT